MASNGIKDRVAIVGMSCTRFAEHWDKSVEDLVIDSATAAAVAAKTDLADIDAFWVGTAASGASGLTLSRPLRLPYKPVTRLENLCATGSESLRNACYAVASGAYDIAMAVGVEKLKDTGNSGLGGAGIPDAADDSRWESSAPANFSILAEGYARAHDLSVAQLREVLTHIARKNHYNGARNPLAQFRKEISAEAVAKSPPIAGMLGVLDCSGVADGAAAAVVVRAEDAYRYTDKPIFVKGLSLVAGPSAGFIDHNHDFARIPEVIAAAEDTYRQAGIEIPAQQITIAEVHDCFTPTELVLMEDLGFSERGTAWRDVLDGAFDLDGRLPVNPSGGLKAFGHPVGASGLRMLYECWLQLRDEAEDGRQVPKARDDGALALTNNVGGAPGDCVSFVGIFGNQPG